MGLGKRGTLFRIMFESIRELLKPFLCEFVGTCWFVELFGTFILCSTVLASATCDNKNNNNSYYALAIGFAIVISAYSFGWVSGGAFNPAVGLLPLYAPEGFNN